jgi:RNA polymerase sigma-70 factor (ECF subfamily)
LQRLGECLKSLAERDRAIVSLSFFQEQTAEEVGEALGMAAGNVRVTRHRALSRLRSCMGLGTEELTS